MQQDIIGHLDFPTPHGLGFSYPVQCCGNCGRLKRFPDIHCIPYNNGMARSFKHPSTLDFPHTRPCYAASKDSVEVFGKDGRAATKEFIERYKASIGEIVKKHKLEGVYSDSVARKAL